MIEILCDRGDEIEFDFELNKLHETVNSLKNLKESLQTTQTDLTPKFSKDLSDSLEKYYQEYEDTILSYYKTAH